MATYAYLTESGRHADRFLLPRPGGGYDVDLAALDEVLAEAAHREAAAVYRELAEEYRRDADVSPVRPVLLGLAVELDRRGNTAAGRAAHTAARARRRVSLAGARHAEVLSRAAWRLHQAAAARHHVPVRLAGVADWLLLAAHVHASGVGCAWCADATCPAVEAARGVLGEPTGRTETADGGSGGGR